MWQEGEMMRLTPGIDIRRQELLMEQEKYHQTEDAVDGRPGQADALLTRRYGEGTGTKPTPVTPDASLPSSAFAAENDSNYFSSRS
jgi:hypothetical protein